MCEGGCMEFGAVWPDGMRERAYPHPPPPFWTRNPPLPPHCQTLESALVLDEQSARDSLHSLLEVCIAQLCQIFPLQEPLSSQTRALCLPCVQRCAMPHGLTVPRRSNIASHLLWVRPRGSESMVPAPVVEPSCVRQAPPPSPFPFPSYPSSRPPPPPAAPSPPYLLAPFPWTVDGGCSQVLSPCVGHMPEEHDGNRGARGLLPRVRLGASPRSTALHIPHTHRIDALCCARRRRIRALSGPGTVRPGNAC